MKFLVLIFLVITGCTSAPKKKEPVIAAPAYNDLYQSAKKDLQTKNANRALQKFNKIIIEAPDTQLAAESHLAIGDYHSSQNRWSDAYASYNQILNGPIKVPFEAEVHIKAAQTLYNQERFSEAFAHVDQAIKTPSISKETLVAGLRWRLALLKKLNDPMEELKTLIHLVASTDDETQKQEYKLQALSIVEGQLSAQQLEDVANNAQYGFVQPQALFRMGIFSFEKSEFSKARAYLSRVNLTAPQTELSERASELLKQIDARETVNPRRIGVVVPLSGRASRFGYKALRGIQLGLGIYGKNRSSYEIAVIDSGSNATQARRAVEKLVTEDHVVGIIGSLSSREATAISSKAQEFGVPSIALSQKAGLTDIGDYVFRNSLTSEMQVRQLVTEAMNVRGITRFAILHPDDAYGIEYANIFWDEVVRNGGEVRGVVSYKSGETDFNQPIRKLIGTFDVEARAWEYKLRLEEWKKNRPVSSRKENPEDILPPIVDFQALFIPDSARAMGQIAPMLAYHDVKDVLLLGTNLWNTNSLIERAGKFLKEPLFVDSILSNDPALTNSVFYKEYLQTFGEAPEEIELQSYDAALLLRQSLDKGSTSRIDLQRSLASAKNISGGLGPLNMTESREVNRPLLMLTVQDNQIVRAQSPSTKK